ncbi:hypothetical protein GCM10010403_15740 [Glycomyces rutgersensis]|uniref:Uncharacterized protein n=1 Tax=Glycomyces rutgersensis TaxID=58115 RepID=A0ABP5SB10_9ACTN
MNLVAAQQSQPEASSILKHGLGGVACLVGHVLRQRGGVVKAIVIVFQPLSRAGEAP